MMLSLFMIFICILTVFFSNKFFLMSKTHDIGVMMISGSSIIRIAKFLIVQNFMIMGIAAPLGALAGCCVFPLVNHVIYLSMNIQAPVFTFSSAALGYCIATLVIVSVWLVIVDAGFVYRMDSMNELLRARRSMNPIGKQKQVFMKIVYVCVYALTIYLLFSIDYHYMNAIFLIYLGVAIVFGAGNVFRYILPDVLTLMKKRMFAENRHFLISLGNLRYSMVNGNLLVTIILLSTAVLFLYLCKFYNDTATFMVVMIAFLVSMLQISICLVYKLSADGLSKCQVFRNMTAIGYLKTDIRKIIKQEIVGFYGIILLLSLPPLLVITSLFAAGGDVAWSFVLQLHGLYIGFLLVAAVVMYRIYMKLIFRQDLMEAYMEE
ncbi:ABC transporter permease, partial [[Clostridium] innocuum]|nr:ABC transporter permease [[Clostridium] innocuum]